MRAFTEYMLLPSQHEVAKSSWLNYIPRVLYPGANFNHKYVRSLNPSLMVGHRARQLPSSEQPSYIGMPETISWSICLSVCILQNDTQCTHDIGTLNRYKAGQCTCKSWRLFAHAVNVSVIEHSHHMNHGISTFTRPPRVVRMD